MHIDTSWLPITTRTKNIVFPCHPWICYDPIRLHQHVLRSRLRNLRHFRPTPICSGTTPCTPLRTPLGLRPTLLWTPRTFVLTSPLPAPFVLLAIGRVPMTHKARFCCCFFVP